MKSPSTRLPVLILWDFAAAFPILAHAWVFEVPKWMKVPLGIVRFIEGIYF